MSLIAACASSSSSHSSAAPSLSVASCVAVYFNFGFSGVNLAFKNISSFALTDLHSHLKRSITIQAYNKELSAKVKSTKDKNLEIYGLVFDGLRSVVTQIDGTDYNFKVTFWVYHNDASEFEEIDETVTKMFEKITKVAFTPEFEIFPHYIKNPFYERCTHQYTTITFQNE
jgi:hypothetical protein